MKKFGDFLAESTSKSAIKAAYNLGQQFATELNNSPHDAQNWSPLGRTDDIPEFDYRTLRDQYGMTPEIEAAYRKGFNATFVPIS